MHDAQHHPRQREESRRRARVRSLRNAVTSVLLTGFMVLPGVANGQNGPGDRAGGAPPSAAPTSTALDVDRLVAVAADRGVLLQRSRPGQRSNSNANTMRWAGVGLLGLGGLLALNGAMSTCGVDVNYNTGSVDTSMCWSRVGIGGGIAAAGLVLMTR